MVGWWLAGVRRKVGTWSVELDDLVLIVPLPICYQFCTPFSPLPPPPTRGTTPGGRSAFLPPPGFTASHEHLKKRFLLADVVRTRRRPYPWRLVRRTKSRKPGVRSEQARGMEYNNPAFDRTGSADWYGQQVDMAKVGKSCKVPFPTAQRRATVSARSSPPSEREGDRSAAPSSRLNLTKPDGDQGNPKADPAGDGTDAGADGQERETWSKKVDFLLSVIGFAVDLGNVWRFPYICHRNGGGAFLVPYFVMVIFGGIPLCYMELSLGQYHQLGPLKIWTKICPLFKGLGYAMILVGMYTSFYYNTIIAWAVFYFFSSFTSDLPWRSCNNTWNTENCTEFNVDTWRNNSVSAATEFLVRNVYEYQNSNGLSELGYIRWQIALCLALVFVIVYFSLWKGIHMSGKVVWVTATLPYILLLILMVRGVTLPGARRGILYFLTPKWETLASPSVWWDAAAQVFFSLGPGFGVLITLSSYNRFYNNTCRDAVATSLMNCLASLLSGFVIFSVLGYISVTQNREIETIAVGGNIMSVLGYISVTQNREIETIAVGGNIMSVLGYISVTQNREIETIAVGGNIMSVLWYISVTQNRQIETIAVGGNITSVLGYISVTQNREIETIAVGGNIMSVLWYISVTQNRQIETIAVGGNITSVLGYISVTQNREIETIAVGGNITSVLGYISVTQNREIETIAVGGNITSVLGFISVTQNREIETIAVGGPGLLFEVYAEAIASMEGATGWALIFFFMLINLGVDSTFGGLETVITSLSDEYPRVLRRHRELFVLVLMCVCYTGALVTTTNGGVLVVHLMDTFAANTSITIVVLLEVTIVCWIYGTERLSCEMREMIGTKPALPWRICWTFICPIILAITIVLGLVYYEAPVYGDYVYPGWAVGVGWGITGSSLVCIPLYAMYKFIITPGNLQQRARRLLFLEDSGEAQVAEIAENGRASSMELNKGLVALPNSNV
ncbi:Sodium-dependent serotonin transporter [Branchiostoma belcheri]|nr:Sodium-dependent serotonin transporter [Branchiostoma belcheri]